MRRVLLLAGVGALLLAAAAGTSQWVSLPRIATAGLPAASATNKSGLVFDETSGNLRVSDGTSWNFVAEGVESSDYAVQTEGPTGADAMRATATTFDGAAFVVRRPLHISSIIARATSVTGGGGTFRVCLLQSANSGSGTANSVGTGSAVLAASGNFTMTFAGAPITLQPGVLFVLFAKDPASVGNITMRTRITSVLDLYVTNVDNATHPTNFTTTISATGCPGTLNPLPTGGGGQTTSSVADLALSFRLR